MNEPLSLEDDFSEDDFARVRHLLQARTGIVIRPQKRSMVISRLSRRLRQCSMTSFSEYLDRLRDDPAELVEFTNVLTTNLTSFFREGHHFADLEQQIAVKRQEGQRRLRIWSAGCSTGEEPYSIGMCLLGSSTSAALFDVKILATDVDTDVLARAQSGLFGVDSLERVPERYRAYISQTYEDRFKINPAVRELVTFKELNLQAEAWPMNGPFDAIFCRNVVIYFENETKERLVHRFARLLAPGGTLYLGHSEALLNPHPLLLSEGRTIYRRKP